MASSSSKRVSSDVNLSVKSKQFKPSDDRVEKKKVENLLNETRSILEEERVERLGTLSQAEWIPTMKLAKVTKKVGKQWNTMGHTHLGESVLYPEEALFLLETNAIEISYGGMPMSLQQAYSVLLGADSTCTLEEYRVYSHLTKYGYRLRRHGCESLMSREEQSEPSEINVLGIISKRKPSQNVSSEMEKVIEETPQKWNCELSTSSKEYHLNAPSIDDDEVKFIEFIDGSKKRKVCETIVIGDENESSINSSKNKIICSGIEGEIPEKNLNDRSNDSLEASNGDSLLVEGSGESCKSIRGLYHKEPFSTLRKDDANVPVTENPTGEFSRKDKVQNKTLSDVSVGSSSDVIVIGSDEESNGCDKFRKEIDNFYQEISLLEVIDITEDDDEKRTSNKASDGKMDENCDFWGILGRIPTMKNEKLFFTIRAPPSDLIPSNIRPCRDEYTINVSVSSEKPLEKSVDSIRGKNTRPGRWRNVYQGRSSHTSYRDGRYQSYHSYHQEWQQSYNAWSPWIESHYDRNGCDPYLPSTSSQGPYQRQHNIPLWLSCVYPRRPYNKSYGRSQTRIGNRYQGGGQSKPSSHESGGYKSTVCSTADEEKYESVVPKNPYARSWFEIKRKGMKTENNVMSGDASENAYGTSYPAQTISPLLKPSESIDVDTVLSKIQVTTSAKRSCDNSGSSTCSLSIKYDLYMPNSSFRKSCPGTPRYRLSVVKSNGSIPKLSDVSHLAEDVKDEVPLLFAMGFSESINFFSFSNVELPVPLKK